MRFDAIDSHYTDATAAQFLIDTYRWTLNSSFTSAGTWNGAAATASKGGNTAQILHGLGGNDTLIGGSAADLIVGGAGSDTLTGNAGSDTFRFHFTNAGTDTITDFDAVQAVGLGGDVLDISYLLDGANANTLTQFVNLVDNAGKLQINIDANGDGSGTDVSVTLANIAWTDASTDPNAYLNAWVTDGHLVYAVM